MGTSLVFNCGIDQEHGGLEVFFFFFVPNKSVLSLMRQKMREKGEAQL